MISKKEAQFAKKMYRNSLTNGAVNLKCAKAALKEIMSQKLAHPARVLSAYKRLIEEALKKEEILVESATKITNQKVFEKELRDKTGVKKIVYKTNPQIIIGARVTHGDWIYDDTLDAKLRQISNF